MELEHLKENTVISLMTCGTDYNDSCQKCPIMPIPNPWPTREEEEGK